MVIFWLEVAAGLRLMWKGGTGWEADDRQRARGPVFVTGLLKYRIWK